MASARGDRVRTFARRWGPASALTVLCLGLGELAFFGLARATGATFFWWRAPLQVGPVLLLLALVTRQRRRLSQGHLVVCSVRVGSGSDRTPGWRRGQARLSPGTFDFTGSPGTVVVPLERLQLRMTVEDAHPVGPIHGWSWWWPYRQTEMTLRGADGELRIKVERVDVDRVEAELRRAPVPPAL